jgi:plastocyanin
MRRTGLRTAIVLAGLVAVALGATSARAADESVTTRDFAFSPGTVTVTEGDTVTWTNADATAHTATGGAFDTERLDPGQTATVTFSTAGSFAYVCAIHPQMTGTIVVQAAAPQPTEAGATPPRTDGPPIVTGRRADVIGSIAVLLAAFGVTMLAATAWTSRRGRRQR